MRAVILAAGIGSRLRPITTTKPKCLVTVAGIPILGHQLLAYRSAGIDEAVVVVGYEAGAVRQYCRTVKGIDIEFVSNDDYEMTNNMYSLFLAEPYIGGREFILSNGDVVFDYSIAKDLIDSPVENAIAAEFGVYYEEAMKVSVDSSNSVVEISKELQPEDSLGSSIDLYRFSSEASEEIFGIMDRYINVEGRKKDWTEVAIQLLLDEGSVEFSPFDIRGRSWVEIDDFNDLAVADVRFSDFNDTIHQKKLFFIDMDGTVYLGDDPIDGAAEWLEDIGRNGFHYYFLSNNSSRSKKEYVDKLDRLGIRTNEDRILLSTDGLIEYLKAKDVERVYVVGTRALCDTLVASGIDVGDNGAEYVVVGYDTELTYEKLVKAAHLIGKGVEILATHPDIVCPTPEGPVPDAGAILALLEKSTGKSPSKVFGKPNPEMISHVLDRHGLRSDEAVVIGDRLYTDLELARRVGCSFVLVLSGETGRSDIETCQYHPDLIVQRISEIETPPLSRTPPE